MKTYFKTDVKITINLIVVIMVRNNFSVSMTTSSTQFFVNVFDGRVKRGYSIQSFFSSITAALISFQGPLKCVYVWLNLLCIYLPTFWKLVQKPKTSDIDISTMAQWNREVHMRKHIKFKPCVNIFKTLVLQIFKRARVKKGKIKRKVSINLPPWFHFVLFSFIQIKVEVN